MFPRGGRANGVARRYVGGAAHLTRGLKLAQENPDIPDVLAWRTRYQLALGEVLGALQNYVSPETEAALAEAVKLARIMAPENERRDPLLARSLFVTTSISFIWAISLGSPLSDELFALGKDRGNPGVATLGAMANGMCRVYQGEIVAARAYLSRTLEEWQKINFPGAADALGLDPVSLLTAFRARMDA